MATGVTETQVHAAADALVAAGERPTVERIRAHLGTGSPNTVTRLLETWWKGLGNRLDAHHRLLVIPEAPEPVQALAGRWWALALEHARTGVLEEVAVDRATLTAAEGVLRNESEALANRSIDLQMKVDAAMHAEKLATAQASELQRLVNQIQGQLDEVTRQRDSALVRKDEADAARQAGEKRLQMLQDAAQSEREKLAAHVQAIENRAHAEVDRARQEIKEVRARLATETKEHADNVRSLRHAADQAKAATSEASREASIQHARAEALEKQLAKFLDLPAALEAAMRRGKAAPKPRKTASKRVAEPSLKR